MMSGNKTRVYYRCAFEQLSPLRISAAGSDESGADVMTDIRAFPLIPGTSIAGVLRERCRLLGADDSLMKSLFGDAGQTGDGRWESKVVISDATLPDSAEENIDFQIRVRSGVRMNDNDRGTAKKGGLFDFETVECRLPYTAVIELPDTADEREAEILESALSYWVAEGVSFGTRTTRGYGKTSVTVSKRSFRFPEQLDEWMAFDPFAPDGFTAGAAGVEPLEAGRFDADPRVEIVVSFRMKGAFSVRKYATEPSKESQRAAPGCSPLSNMERLPVIPGTSWAGNFRHHMRRLARQTERSPEAREEKLRRIDALFGKIEGGGRRSKIRFSETVVEGSRRHPVTRISVDRFTSASRGNGLFISTVAWGGTGTLTVTLPPDTDAWLLRLFSAALNDLDLGLMTVGGESNAGRGICELTSLCVNGVEKLDAVRACGTDYLIAGGA